VCRKVVLRGDDCHASVVVQQVGLLQVQLIPGARYERGRGGGASGQENMGE
jgi:hypothetical protein